MATTAAPTRSFDRLRKHSIGLPQVVFQSITRMAPGAAVAYSIYISVPFSQQALALSVLLALVACLCAATAIGQLARLEPSAGGLYACAARSLGPWAGFIVASTTSTSSSRRRTRSSTRTGSRSGGSRSALF
jgi:amino acid transporter